MRYIEKFKVPVRFTVFRALTPPGGKRCCALITLNKCVTVRTFRGNAASRLAIAKHLLYKVFDQEM